MKHTAESRAKLSRSMKRRWALIAKVSKENGDGGSKTEVGNAISESTVAFAVGHVEAWLQAYASSADIPARTLTRRVADILQRKAHG